MPIYEYRCEKCGKVLEVLQKFSDTPLETHEECGGQLEKLISHSAFKLKGSGWYATDYAKGTTAAAVKTDGNGAADSKPAEGKSESSSDSKGESKSDSKTETKTESKPAATTTAKTD